LYHPEIPGRLSCPRSSRPVLPEEQQGLS
jgi:hypothetical protein